MYCRLFVFSCLICLCFSAGALPDEKVNASFERLDDSGNAEGWIMDSPKGGVLSGQASHGEKSIWTEGTGAAEELLCWRSQSFDLEPGCHYLLQLDMRREELGRGGGSALVGVEKYNVDVFYLPEIWKTIRYGFRTPHREEEYFYRVGQWQDDSRFHFDNLSLVRAMPVHARFGEVELGEGERIRGNDYFFSTTQIQSRSNVHRFSREFTNHFNTDRLIFFDGAYAIFEHEVAEHLFDDLTLLFWTRCFGESKLKVEVSRTGEDWLELGVLGEGKRFSLKPPAEFFPMKSLWVRLSGSAVAERNLQILEYRVEAKLGGKAMTAFGSTRWMEVQELAEGLEVEVDAPALHNPDRSEEGITVRATKDGEPLAGEVTLKAGGQVFSKAPFGEALTVPIENTLDELTLESDGIRLYYQCPFPEYFHTAYGEKLGDGLWWASSGWKIRKNRGMPTATGTALRIETAKNEAEAAQLVLLPEKTLHHVRVSATDLKSAEGAVISGGAVDVLRVRHVPVMQPTDPTAPPADWADPLPPQKDGLTVKAGVNQPFWIRVKPGKDAPAGEYSGQLIVTADDYRQEVPFELRVFDFTLPDRMSCVSTFGLNHDMAIRYHGATADADKRRVVDSYLQAMADHHLTPHDLSPLDPFIVHWPDISPENPPEDIKSLKVHFDWEAYDRGTERGFQEFHFNSVRVPVQGMGWGNFYYQRAPSIRGFTEDTEVYQHLFADYCRQLGEHFEEKGWIEDSFIYWFDEPEEKDYPFVMNGFNKFKKHAPKIGRMITEEIHEGLYGGPNIWCPLPFLWNEKDARAREALGEKIWWYVCTLPKEPYAGLFIDHPATDFRVWLWQTWERNIVGFLIWHSILWHSVTGYPDPEHPQNPYEDTMAWSYSYGEETPLPWGNGDARFLYPPEAVADGRPSKANFEAPVDTIRIEMLRDGIEDYEYLAMLRSAIEEKKEHLTEEELETFTALLEVPDTISKTLSIFTKDPAPIEAQRRKVAEALEILEKR
ncbi:MAG: DUF4091 domain-containing protein [Candidatus Hydrogenedens sp.]|jgi:predicted house-cleaning noncanonical NTP pyrophosphatase (MazG superfamily)|nr:DUF4091 domain-containing protein [Candidatus Hydrogenedens sp.]